LVPECACEASSSDAEARLIRTTTTTTTNATFTAISVITAASVLPPAAAAAAAATGIHRCSRGRSATAERSHYASALCTPPCRRPYRRLQSVRQRDERLRHYQVVRLQRTQGGPKTGPETHGRNSVSS